MSAICVSSTNKLTVSACYLDKHLHGCSGLYSGGGSGVDGGLLKETVHLRKPQNEPGQFTQLFLHSPSWKNGDTHTLAVQMEIICFIMNAMYKYN